MNGNPFFAVCYFFLTKCFTGTRTFWIASVKPINNIFTLTESASTNITIEHCRLFKIKSYIHLDSITLAFRNQPHFSVHNLCLSRYKRLARQLLN